MTLFEFNVNTISFKPETLAIKEFKKIWDEDDTNAKDVAYLKLCYVFHLCDIKSPYNSYSMEDREGMVRKDILVGIKVDKDITAACVKYRELSKGKAARLLEDAYDALDKLRDYFKNANLNEKDKNGKLTYSSKEMISNLKELASVFRSVKELEKEVDVDEIGDSRIRGGVNKGIFEDPDMA